jgi:hypothetical protein
MTLSAILEMLNASFMMLFLLILAMISPAEAVITCTSTSNQCCWVRRLWESMKGVTFTNTGATACCKNLNFGGITGVTCNSDGTVTEIKWNNQGLSGSIPPEIGNLVSLQIL